MSDRSNASEPQYDIADELAALNPFRLLEELEPAFYERHWPRICFIRVTVSQLARESGDLHLAMGVAAHLDVLDAADLIRRTLRQIEWPEGRLRAYRDELEQPLRAAYRLVLEADLPEWLHAARDIIRAAFIGPTTGNDRSSAS